MINLENIKLPSNIKFVKFCMGEGWGDVPLFSMKVMDKEAEEERTISFYINANPDYDQDPEGEWEDLIIADGFRDIWGDSLDVNDTLMEDTMESVTFKNGDCDEYAEGSITNEEAVQKILEKLSKLSYSDIVA